MYWACFRFVAACFFPIVMPLYYTGSDSKMSRPIKFRIPHPYDGFRASLPNKCSECGKGMCKCRICIEVRGSEDRCEDCVSKVLGPHFSTESKAFPSENGTSGLLARNGEKAKMGV